MSLRSAWPAGPRQAALTCLPPGARIPARAAGGTGAGGSQLGRTSTPGVSRFRSLPAAPAPSTVNWTEPVPEDGVEWTRRSLMIRWAVRRLRTFECSNFGCGETGSTSVLRFRSWRTHSHGLPA